MTTDENLEQIPEVKEQAKPVSKEEQAKQVSPPPEEVVSVEKVVEEPKFTKDDVTQKLEEAKTAFFESDEFKKAIQSAKDVELHPLQEKVAELKRKERERDLGVREKVELEEWGDTDEVKKFQAARRKLEEDKVALEPVRAEVEKQAKINLANALAKEHEVDVKPLLEAKSPEDMEIMALKMSHQKLVDKAQEIEKTPQQIDSGATSVAGVDYGKMSPHEKIQQGVKEQEARRK